MVNFITEKITINRNGALHRGVNPWEVKEVKMKFWLIVGIISILLSAMPYFFHYIQSREGVKLDDYILDALPAYDCSVPIFFMMYSISLYGIYRSWHNSWIFFRYGTAYAFIALIRACTLLLFPMEPPTHLVSLTDPFVEIFYGGAEITKDLMFSGHTSSMFLIFLVMDCGKGRMMAFFVWMSVAIMLLLQHIHYYSIDIIVALFVTYFCYWLAGIFIGEHRFVKATSSALNHRPL